MGAYDMPILPDDNVYFHRKMLLPQRCWPLRNARHVYGHEMHTRDTVTEWTDRVVLRPGSAMAYREQPLRLEKVGPLSVLDGARLVVKSRYLLSIVAILALYEFCSQILDFQFSSVLAKALAGGRNTQAYLGSVYLATNVLAFASQLILTTLLVKRSGPGAGLIILPAAMSLSSGAFCLEPSQIGRAHV